MKRCADNYSSPDTKLMYHFLQFLSTRLSNRFNVLFQVEGFFIALFNSQYEGSPEKQAEISTFVNDNPKETIPQYPPLTFQSSKMIPD